MCTTALACTDALFIEAELANGNTAGSFGYQKLDEHKLSYLSSALRQKFDSPSFEIQWENVKAKINSKCRGKRRTLVKRLKKQANFKIFCKQLFVGREVFHIRFCRVL